MNEIHRIQDQLRRAFEGKAWHGPSVREVLRGVTPEIARRRPIPQAHTIWELALHLQTWQDAVRKVLEGRSWAPSAEEDWPATGGAEDAAWSRALQDLEDSHSRLMAALATVNEERLEEIVSDRQWTLYQLLHGVVQHSVFHAGQINILKKNG